MSEKRILIIGGGFAGVQAALGASATLRAAHERAVSVELVSPDPFLVIRPRLYEADLGGVRVPLSRVLGPLGVKHLHGAVSEIDVSRHTVRLDRDSERVGYDQLVLAAGSRMALPEGPAVHSADTYAQALELQAAIRRLMRSSSAAFDAVIVGGGFTGIELAAELAGTLINCAARAAGPLAGGTVTLIERNSSVASAFGPRARSAIEQALGLLGVRLITGARVREVDPDGVTLESGSRIEAQLVVWATGMRPSPLAEQLPTARDRLGRVAVDPFLATGIEGIWAAGDSAAARVDGDHVAMMSCQHAMPQGRRAGENAAATLLGRRLRRYHQPLYLTCLDLGAQGALLTCGFDRDTILASGEQAKAFKRFINRSLIYPPASTDSQPIQSAWRPATVGRPAAALARIALRSEPIRRRITASAEDRSALFETTAGDGRNCCTP